MLYISIHFQCRSYVIYFDTLPMQELCYIFRYTSNAGVMLYISIHFQCRSYVIYFDTLPMQELCYIFRYTSNAGVMLYWTFSPLQKWKTQNIDLNVDGFEINTRKKPNYIYRVFTNTCPYKDISIQINTIKMKCKTQWTMANASCDVNFRYRFNTTSILQLRASLDDSLSIDQMSALPGDDRWSRCAPLPECLTWFKSPKSISSVNRTYSNISPSFTKNNGGSKTR